MGSQHIAEQLRVSGIDLGERTVRNYLAQSDELGWTENLGRRGRRLTSAGRLEVEGALVVDKVGFVAARVDTLAYQMSFDVATRKGKVILNISTLAPEDLPHAAKQITKVFDANLGMGRLLAFGRPGERIGEFRVPQKRVAIGTVCSVSINGIFLRANVAMSSRFGGLLQLESGKPRRFVQIINYDGSSLDPLEIFIRGHMTSVTQAAASGSGMLGASFREAPMVALPEIQRLSKLSEQVGLGSVLAIGSPNQPLLDVPVGQGRVGVVVCGGLNPMAAVVESGIDIASTAMSTLCEFDELIPYKDLPRRV